MSKNYHSIKWGEKTIGLKMNNRALDILKDLTGIDPFAFKIRPEVYEDFKADMINIVHACILSNYASKKEVPDFDPKEAASEWVVESTLTDWVDMGLKWTQAHNGVQREGTEDTREGTLNVG